TFRSDLSAQPARREPMSLTDPDTMNSDETMTETSADPATEPNDELRLLEAADIPALIDELTAFYAPRGVNIVHVAGGWTIRTAPDLAPRLKLTQKVGRKLSRASIETLTIVAY